MSYFSDNADFIREKAAEAGSLPKLWGLLGWPDYQSVRAANAELNLGLDVIHTVHLGPKGSTKSAAKSDLPVVGKKRGAAPAGKGAGDA